MTSMQYPSGRVVHYVYGAAALYPSRIEVEEADGSGQASARVLLHNLTYDVDGQLAGFTDERGQVSFTATWDLAGQARRRTYDSPAGRFDWDVSARDGNGNILSATDLATGKKLGTEQQPLGYDEQDRLVSAVGERLRGYQDCAYAYDLAGNRTEETCYDKATSYLYDAGSNRMSALSWQGPASCDPPYPRITRSIARDARGRQTMAFQSKFPASAQDSVSLGYGPNGRLVSVDTDGQAPPEITYGYDHRNQRVLKVDGLSATRFTYDDSGLLLAEERPGGSLEYIYLRGVLLGVTSHPGTPASQTWTAATDHLGTPVRLFDAETSEIVWAADYEAFGRAYEYVQGSRQSPSVTLNLRFPGQYFDQETGLHYNWHRYYNPDTGAYLQVDPVIRRTTVLDEGAYVYARSNPLKWVDPLGLYSQVCWRPVAIPGLRQLGAKHCR